MSKKELFPNLNLEEKRKLLDLTEFYLAAVLSDRKGERKLINVGVDYPFLDRLSDEEIEEAAELIHLCQKATNASDPKESIRIYEKIIKKAPFDSISMLSIGVCYANLGNGKKAISYVEKALKIDPTNQRIRENLTGIRNYFG